MALAVNGQDTGRWGYPEIPRPDVLASISGKHTGLGLLEMLFKGPLSQPFLPLKPIPPEKAKNPF